MLGTEHKGVFKIKPIIRKKNLTPTLGRGRTLSYREQCYFDHPDYDPSSSTLHIYSDGSTIGNGQKNATGGYGVFFGHPEIPYISKDHNIPGVTNNITELKAIIEALKVIETLPEAVRTFVIHYDSDYAASVITGKKKAHKNIELVDEGKTLLRTLQQRNKVVKFEHVYSHTGGTDLHSVGNSIVDDLAKRKQL